MRSSRIHIHSAITGAALALAALLAVGAGQATKQVVPIPVQRGPVRIAGIPDPRDMMVVEEGIPFTVPAGKIFVLTGFGSSKLSSVTASVRVDGAEAISTGPTNTSIVPVPAGFTVSAGKTVEVDDGSINVTGRAWGYLVDA